MAVVGAAPVGATPDRDAARLRELGYPQELARRLRLLDNAAMGFAAISPVVGLYARRARRHRGRRPGVGVGAAGRAGRPVPAARRLRRAGLRVPDRRRRLPVEPPADGRRLRLVQRLGRDLRVRRGEHDDRLPRRAVGADAARHRADRRTRSWSTGMVLVVVCAVVGALRHRACSAASVKAGIAAEVVASVGIGLALLLAFREQDVSLLGETLGAEALSGGSVGAGAARRAGRRRLGLHRLRRVRGRLGGDARRGAPRPAGDLDRAAQRRRARDPQRGRRHARASRPGGGRRRARRRPGHDRRGRRRSARGRRSRSPPSCSSRSSPAGWRPRR